MPVDPTPAFTAPFWEAAQHGVLVRQVCDDCHRSFFVPQVACPYCRSDRWSYQPSSGRGRIYSHTTVYRPPEPEFEGPYVLAIVDLDEGWTMLSRLVGELPLPEGEPGYLIGQDVEVDFTADPRDPERMLPTFRVKGVD